jgi:hypothetical protein
MLLVLLSIANEDAIGNGHKAKSGLDYLEALVRSVQGEAIHIASTASFLRPKATVRSLGLSCSCETQVESIVLERTAEVPSAEGDLK